MRTPDIPQFTLYGELAPINSAEFLHIELIETRSRMYDWHIASHTHQGLFQIVFLLGGQVKARIDSATWDCTGPTVITIHPSVVHGFEFSKEAHGFVLTMDQSLLFGTKATQHDDIFSDLFLEPLAIDLSAAPEIRQRIESLLGHLMAEFARPLDGHALMLDWLARSVLLLLLRQHTDYRSANISGRDSFETFSRFRALVEAHYQEQWSVAQYAHQLHIAEIRLNRLCLKLGGKTAFDMAQHRLMLEARRKLTYVPASVSSIAYELGFQDPAYFSRAFKRHTGMTPKQFRQQSVSAEP
ncbi:helix-turn-helix domain-containing protein [Glaciimonas sp. PAMC28666]|uniref:helix-turn-helix domain-containing protein n=1 Tax=Glaciimonas sp. PAMC28666 TaxID=2807626 RepID=UPI00196375FB|nr:helix-turn-helix domain-containing protein [Glaciimonas sp. PAMC28666]QRX82393.1 helix-turn-helix domain-containing protein [Glaciimonas sp. PAMC28666]